MPLFESNVIVAGRIEDIFDYLTRPANLLALTPPAMKLVLVEAPEQLSLGSKVTIRTRRFGIPVRATSEVVVFEPPHRFVEEQRSGPFRRWVHAHSFEACDGGVTLKNRIDFETPGGLLGLTVTAASVLRDLEAGFAYRREKLLERFGIPPQVS